jgi:O-antigen ligase
MAFCCAIALVPLLQLVPLPPVVWTRLPGRAEVAGLVGLLGGDTPWLPISLSAHSTWLSLLSLLPPVAIFIAAIQLSYLERRHLSLLIIAMGVVSVFIGLTQVAQGSSSPLRFFSVTNPTEAVGFFANRNHFAALLYAVLVFAAVWAIDVGFKIGTSSDIRTLASSKIAGPTAIFLIFIIVIAGEAMARSRAGLALTMVALLAAFGLAFMDQRRRAGTQANKFLFVIMTVAVLVSVQFALYRILDRFGTDPLEQARSIFARVTIAAASAFMPFGSGSGTFVPIYQLFERAPDLIAGTYANHAHDDFLEIWLETGIAGPVMICVFLVWWGIATVQLWRKPPADIRAFDCTLARAATVVIGLLLAHSLVDYPMRTAAIMAIFAVCCAFLIEPVRVAEEKPWIAPARVREASGRSQLPLRAAGVLPSNPSLAPVRDAGSTPPPRQLGGRWGEDIEWPDEWRNTGEKGGRSAGRTAGQRDPVSARRTGLPELEPKSQGDAEEP